MELHVLTWFHREPRGPRGSSRTGWTRGLQAYLDLDQALAGLEVVKARALEHAGHGAPPPSSTGGVIPADSAERDLGASHADLVTYTVAEPLTPELLVAVVSSPPRGDPGGPWDPLVQASDWWDTAKVVATWWGGALATRSRPGYT